MSLHKKIREDKVVVISCFGYSEVQVEVEVVVSSSIFKYSEEIPVRTILAPVLQQRVF